MCLGALATQTGGSITRPASYCGVYSIKPTYGRVSVDGVLPLAQSMDHVGAMANCVRDLAILLQPIARTDANEIAKPYHYLSEIDGPTSSSRFKQLTALPDFPATPDSDTQAAFDALRAESKRKEWAWNALPLPPSFADVPQYHYAVMAVEAASYHADRMRRHPSDYPPKVRGLIEHGLSWSAPDYARVTVHLAALRDEMEERFVDSWKTYITPATAGAAPSAESTGNPAFNSPWSYTALPTVSLPFAWSADILPLAVQLVGQKWCEHDLLATAAMLEADIGFERRPLPL